MFGPVRAAPEIRDARDAQANPMSAIGAAAMLLRHIGQPEAAARVENAMMITTATEVTAEGALLSRFRTDEVASMVINHIR